MSARLLSVATALFTAASVAGWSTRPLVRHTACRLSSQLPRLTMTEAVGTGVSTPASSSHSAEVETVTWGVPNLNRDEEECEIEFTDPEEDAALWPWRLLLLAVTGTWGANFAAMKLASDALGSAPEAVTRSRANRLNPPGMHCNRHMRTCTRTRTRAHTRTRTRRCTCTCTCTCTCVHTHVLMLLTRAVGDALPRRAVRHRLRAALALAARCLGHGRSGNVTVCNGNVTVSRPWEIR